MAQHAEINSLIAECDRLVYLDPSLSLQYAEEAYALLAGCDTPLLVRVTLAYSRSLVAFGRLEESLACLLKALTQAEVENQRSVQEGLLQELALSYYSMGQYEEAAEYWADCINSTEFSAATKLNGHIGIGMIYFAYGQIDQALAQHKMAISLLNNQMPAISHARAWINLAASYFKLKQWHESQHALVMAYPFAQGANHQEFVAEIYLYMAQIALETNNLDAARHKLAQAKRCCKVWAWGEIQQQLLHGRIFLATSRLDDAIYYFKQALKNANEMGASKHILKAYHLLSMAYQRAGDKENAENAYGCYQAACVRGDISSQTECLQKINKLLTFKKDCLEMLHCA
ncbi:lipopolysaccharide assembly protein LapB [Iodobacter sp.]|uniref:tetratricopeptide repeat protein n=1 Tax=Iodobacter sp. TaxID=1915058 RepID=UPI0025E417FB|nr:tetratricopeptide repeat protein [Iodobacter sp.]